MFRKTILTATAALGKNSPGRSADPRRSYRLNEYTLKDIGLSRGEINRAELESFWRD